MKKILLTLAVILLAACSQSHPVPPAQNPTLDRAAWMNTARWGIFTHYLIDWRLPRRTKPTPDKWNDMVDHFDVNALADQLASLHCPYYVLTIGQNSGAIGLSHICFETVTPYFSTSRSVWSEPAPTQSRPSC